MKKQVVNYIFKSAVLGVVTVGVMSVPIPEMGFMPRIVAAEVVSGAVEVRTIQEFEVALANVNVTEISIKGSFAFRKNIGDVPARDIILYGNKAEGHVVDSKAFAINGKQSTLAKVNAGENNLFSIVDMKITAAQVAGRFFTGGAGNGPSSYGWDVYAKDVEYDGDRFVHLSEGKLTFDGVNTIATRAENAWVHQLEFTPGTVYNGQAAMKDHGQFSAFYFNGRLVDGQATGKVDIGANAKISIVISPQSDVNYYYPAFYDKVYQVNLGQGAKLDIDAAGVGFQFIPRADYKNIPSLNLAQKSKMTVNGRGGGHYATMKIQEYGSQINMDVNSELLIDGNSKKGVVESIYEFASFNIDGAKNLEITNHMAGKHIFFGDRTFIRGTDLKTIETWEQTGGDYDRLADRLFNTNGQFSTYVGLKGDGKDNAINGQVFSPNEETATAFQLDSYGKVRFLGGKGS
ncbi:pectate lyase-like adhesive domain-containing protein [uncultured Vagococcus sp.]|uniref:pectate lyase-like adhesive domain-containing protein n=1 Tax=uncultured Vagococcus sp. TaxID=189676 RepID=UPI0028D8646D|nr:pectate lyase-like adhesive domain-containing protein [uncultured Vagococcus sp.]